MKLSPISLTRRRRLLPSLTQPPIAATTKLAVLSPPTTTATGVTPPPSDDHFTCDVEHLYRILTRYHPNTAKLEVVLRQSGVLLRPGLAERVLRRCGDAGKLSYKFFLWATDQPGFTPTYTLYRILIKTLAKMKQFGAVWSILEQMRKHNPSMISPELFIILIRRFASSRLLKRAVEVLEEMPEYGCPPNGHIFGCLLDALCKKGKVKEASSLLEEMKYRFPPCLKSFTALVNGWCREGKMVEAKMVMVEMKKCGVEADVVVYNILVGGYVHVGMMGEAYWLLGVMREMGCHPNVTSYTTLISGLCSAGRTPEAVRVFREMETAGCKADAVTFTTLIRGFCRGGEVEKGYSLLGEMRERGVRPDAQGYLSVLTGYEKRQDLGMCVKVMEEMKRAGCAHDGGVYQTVIRLAVGVGDVEEAAELWEEMEAVGPSPDLDTYVAMVHGLVNHGCLADAVSRFKEMVGRGVHTGPQYGTLKVLLNSLLRAGEVEMAKEAWGCLTANGCEVNGFCWTVWVNGLFSAGRLKEACFYCVDMLNAGEMPQVDTFARLMRGLRKTYNRRIAVEITDKVRAMAAERRVSFKMYKRRGEKSLAAKVMTKMRVAMMHKEKRKRKRKSLRRLPSKAKARL